MRSNDCFMTNDCLGITGPALLHIKNEKKKENLHQGRGWRSEFCLFHTFLMTVTLFGIVCYRF